MNKFGGMLAAAPGMMVLAGCGDAAVPAVETVTSTATETRTETATATQTVTEGASPTVDAAADPTEAFLAEFEREVWADLIVEIIRESGLTIRTSLVDPRGPDGSTAAEMALDICRAGQEMLEGEGVASPTVRVREADDSTFVVLGLTGDSGCTEY